MKAWDRKSNLPQQSLTHSGCMCVSPCVAHFFSFMEDDHTLPLKLHILMHVYVRMVEHVLQLSVMSLQLRGEQTAERHINKSRYRTAKYNHIPGSSR